jgi:Cu/Ag efflux protein CusF
MKNKSLLLAALIVAISCSHKKEKPKEYEVMKNTAEETAKVQNIDYKTRKITLSTNDGPVTIVAGDQVKNFDQIKKGDTVKAQYQEALVYTISEKGEAESAKISSDVKTAKAGETPAASTTTELTASLVVTDINRDANTVTLRNAGGEKEVFKVQHPERLKDIDVGDVVNIKYSEAMAVKVEKAGTL